jgi:hypothetical protein
MIVTNIAVVCLTRANAPVDSEKQHKQRGQVMSVSEISGGRHKGGVEVSTAHSEVPARLHQDAASAHADVRLSHRRRAVRRAGLRLRRTPRSDGAVHQLKRKDTG